jgi:hypothetical protein
MVLPRGDERVRPEVKNEFLVEKEKRDGLD